MSKWKIILICITSAILSFGFGAAFGFLYKPTKTKIIPKTKIEYKIIEKDINKLSDQTIKKELNCYYTAEPTLELKQKGKKLNIHAGLCEREWSRTYEIETGEKKNMISGAYTFRFDTETKQIYHEGELMYHRKLFNRLWLGTGISASEKSVGIKAQFGVEF